MTWVSKYQRPKIQIIWKHKWISPIQDQRLCNYRTHDKIIRIELEIKKSLTL